MARPSAGSPAPGPKGSPGGQDLGEALSRLRAWAGAPSFSQIAQTITRNRLHRGVPESEARVARSTVYDFFRPGRRRLDADLFMEIVSALGVTGSALEEWREQLRSLPLRPAALASVQVHNDLPEHMSLHGREEDLGRLVPLTDSTLIAGMAGVGKTVLAHEAIRRLLAAGTFAGVLRVNLDGFSSRQPADPAAVLEALVRAGSDASVTQGSLEEAYQAMLRTRPVVVLLDNAGTAEQVAELLPAPDSPSRALVTSRRSLGSELGISEIVLAPLGAGPAAELLAAASGRAVSADAEGVGELVTGVGGLPLVLVLAGQRLGARPDWSVADHVVAHRRRLEALQLDDAVQASLALSYVALGDPERRALRLLASAPVLELAPGAVASLLGVSLAEAYERLRSLESAHLVRRATGERVEMHDLVRVFAARESVEQDAPSELAAALDRLLAHYLDILAAAVRRSHPHTRHTWWWEPRNLPELTDEEAVAWLGAERAAIIALAGWAGEQDRPEMLVKLAQVVAPYLWEGPDAAATVTLQRHALAAAQQLADPRAVALAHRLLGQSMIRAGDNEGARSEIERAGVLSDRTGVVAEQVRCRNALALLCNSRGASKEAVELVEDALALAEESPEDEFVAGLLLNLGVFQFTAGYPDQAIDSFERTVVVSQGLGLPQYEQWARNNLIELLIPAGRLPEAIEHVHRASELARRRGDQVGEAYVASNRPMILLAEGRHEDAVEAALDALSLARGLDHGELEALTLCSLGDALVVSGAPDRAREAYADALDVGERIGDEAVATRAREGLGAVT